MRKRWVIPLLSVGILAALVWGYNQYQVRRSYEIHTENQYNRAFAELSTHVDGLETQLSKSLASNSPPILMRFFSDIWRQSYAAQSDLGQLPLGTVELSRTKTFVAKVAAFTYGLAVNRDIRQKPLSEQEWRTLRDMHKTSQYISGRITALQEEMLRGSGRWTEVDRLGATSAVSEGGRGLQTNKVTKSFMMMEDGMKRLPNPDFEGNMLNFKETPHGLTGPNISMEQGKNIARQFVPGGFRMSVVFEGRNRGNFPVYVYSLSNTKAKNAAPIRVAVSVKGGHVAWMLHDRNPMGSRVSLSQAEQLAQNFLAAKGLGPVTPVARESFGNTATISLAHNDQGYVIYPELIKIQVAQDNGEIIGMEAVPFLTFHQPNRVLPRPRLNEKEIRARLNPHLKVERLRTAVILNDRYKEVPCYEATGRLDDQRYRVYLSAAGGVEEKIERISAQGTSVD